jgi:N-acetylglucosamine-6-phosphate deacetylase
VAVLTLAGCGKAAEQGIKTMATAPTATADAACRTEHATLVTAVEAYTLTNGTKPTRNADLVGDILRDPPRYYQVAADGSIVLSAAGTAAHCQASYPAGS